MFYLYNKKGFTLLEIFIVLTVLATVSAISIYYFTDYIEDARMAVRKTNVKLVNEALNQYYKDNMSYPKYQWRKDDPSDLSNNKNNGLDDALSKYFVNKTPSQIIKEATEGKGFKIYYRVTKPRRKNRLEDASNVIPENSLDVGTWKMAKNLRVETFDYLVNEIRIDDSGLETTTFDNLESFNFPLILDSSPIGKSSSNYNTIEVDKDLDIKMVCCPPGTFKMGAPTNELGKKNNENLHNVTITKQFLISKYEITQKQYKIVMGTNPSQFNTNEMNPVEKVTLENAKAFCEKLNTEYSRLVPYGYKFDLPTEAQWEYACRAGTTTALNNNKNLTPKADKPQEFDTNCPNIREVAWFQNNSGNKTHQVGTKAPNAWGLYDMHGNVEEIIKDLRHKDYPPYSPDDVEDPLITREMIVGSDSVVQRCHRGGGYNTTADRCRSASRQGSAMNNAAANIGFRVVLVSTE